MAVRDHLALLVNNFGYTWLASPVPKMSLLFQVFRLRAVYRPKRIKPCSFSPDPSPVYREEEHGSNVQYIKHYILLIASPGALPPYSLQ
jgi:hypothetical protein